MQTQPIIGMWQTAIKIEGMTEGFEGLYTFFADGNFLETNSFNQANSGVWTHSDGHYALTFWAYLFDEGGQANSQATSKVKVRFAIQLVDANHFTGHGVGDTYDLVGQPMTSPSNGPVTIKGRRVEVELL